MTDSFYLTLNSHAAGEFFSTNTNTNFKTHLGKMITLENSWEVALTELRVPMTLANMHSDMCNVVALSNETDKDTVKKFSIKSGYYKSNHSFITELNGVFRDCLVFTIDDGIINIETLNETAAYYFPDALSQLLGFKKNTIIGQNYYHTADVPINIQTGLSSTLNVNIDIIEHQLIDNTHNTCLRSVSSCADTYNFGFDKLYSFQRLQYKKVKCTRLEYIGINISDEKNRQVSFLSGNSSVQLHFRRALE